MSPARDPTIPQVRLYCFDNLNRNIEVPAQKATEHNELVRIARHKYGRDKYPEETYDVHFHYLAVHIDKGHCNAELDDMLYDEGAYFARPYVREPTLRLYAHFVAKAGPSPVGATEITIKTETPEGFHEATPSVPRVRTPTLHQRRQRNPSPVADEPGDNDDKIHDDTLATHRAKRPRTSEAATSARAALLVSKYPALPVEAIPARFLQDFQSAVNQELALPQSVNASEKTRMGIARSKAHGTLSGSNIIFSVMAIDPCNRCIRQGRTCRVYHPSMYLDPWAGNLRSLSDGFQNKIGLGERCSWCRVHHGTFCGVDTNIDV